MADVIMRDAPAPAAAAAAAGAAAIRRRAEQTEEDTAGPVIGPAPRGTSSLARGAVPRTEFSEAYRSIFTLNQPDLIPLLRHVNCNYLSTKGHAPTLMELKQHAQALVILLKQITLSTQAGVIDGANQKANPNVRAKAPSFNENETFDFLNDLGDVYENNTLHHNLPLPTLLNTLEPQPVEPGTMRSPGSPDEFVDIDICPLHPVDPAPLDGPSLPYATHEALLKHANEALELIDHEYSAKGGLLGVLPHNEDEDRPLAETTLLGQMILYIQRLVARLHNLERLHANAMDVMRGEAVVPHQALSRVGPDGRSGRELVYPQDRFVLVNAGDDVWQFLNDEFEKKERVDEKIRTNHLHLGVEGEKLWEVKGRKEYSRGITAIDVITRYYRLRNDNLKTIFVIPAHAEHPGVKVTRDMERKPTVVSVVKPIWPERVSVLEKRTRDDLDELRHLRSENDGFREAAEVADTERAYLVNEVKVQRAHAFKAKERLKTFTEGPERDRLGMELDAARATLERERRELQAQRAQLQIQADQLQTRAQKLAADEQRAATRRETENRRFAARKAALEATYQQRLVDLENDRLAAVESGTRLADEFQKAWTVQLESTQVLVDFLNNDRAKSLLAAHLIPDDIGERGVRGAQEVVERVLKRLGGG